MQWHPNPIERRVHASLKWSTFPDAETVSPIWTVHRRLVSDTVNRSLEHGIFGYGIEPKGFREAWVDHLHNTHQWTIVLTGLCLNLLASFRGCGLRSWHTQKHSANSGSTPAYPYF